MRKYGWKPDVPDHRDHIFSAPLRVKLPEAVDLRRRRKTPIEDQGNIGSCTGHAATSAVELTLSDKAQYSRLMAYYNGRRLENNTAYDDGAYIRDVIKGLKKWGCANEPQWPYVESKFDKMPPADAYKDAALLPPRIGAYLRITTLSGLKAALASGAPVIFGFAVPEYFQSNYTAKTGWLPFPSDDVKIIGGHAVLAVGYKDNAKVPYVLVQNSWGPEWGIKGHFQMDQTWFSSPKRMVDDMWIVRKAS